MCISLGRKLVRQVVVRTSEQTYQGYFRCWMLFRVSAGLPVFLLARAGGDSHVRSLLEYTEYAWGINGLTAGTIAGHLAAVKFFRRQERGPELFLRHPWIVDALNGVTCSHALAGIKLRIRRPVVWSVLLAGESLCNQ